MTDSLSPSMRARAIEPTMIRSLRAGMGPSTIDLGLGQTDLAVGAAVRRQMREELAGEFRTPYTPNAGLDEARAAVADHVGAAVGEVMLTCGVQEGLAVAILGLCEEGDEVLVPNPGFPAYINLVRAAGAEPVEYPLRAPTAGAPGWDLDPDAVIDRISDSTRLLVLNNPSNPTGAVFGEASLQKVIDACRRRSIGWVSDEIYEDYVWTKNRVSAREIDDEGGFVLSGLSKSHHMMGWRLGWMVGPAEAIADLTPLHQHLVTCAPRPAQQAAIASLADHVAVVERTRDIFAARRRRVLEAFDGVGFGSAPTVDGAFYLFLDVRPWLEVFESTAEIAARLLDEEDVMVVPGEGFGPAGLGHLRVAFTIGGEQLDEGLGRLRRFLMRHRPSDGG